MVDESVSATLLQAAGKWKRRRTGWCANLRVGLVNQTIHETTRTDTKFTLSDLSWYFVDLFFSRESLVFSSQEALVIMFCSNCGKGEQTPDSYCRSCGEFLVDPASRYSLINRILGISRPEKQLNVTLTIDLVTSIVSGLLMVFLMGYFDGRFQKTGVPAPPIVYFVYLFLGLLSAWQLLSFVIGVKLKTKLSGAKRSGLPSDETMNVQNNLAGSAHPALPSIDHHDIVSPGVTEDTMRNLDRIPR